MGWRPGAALQQAWWQRATPAWVHLLRPLAWIYRLLWAARRCWFTWRRPAPLPVPVIVVGNLVVGGAGKTPTVIALVRALKSQGRTPGVVSRGWGRQEGTAQAVEAIAAVTRGSTARDVGDEPLLIHRVTGAPVMVGRHRRRVAEALLAAHPEVDVIISDDGLQHLALPRQLQLLVFDDRGVGNGLLLPAGPLRQPVPRTVPADSCVLYNAKAASTSLPGAVVRRSISTAVPLNDWLQGSRHRAVPIAGLRGPPLLAAAGIAEPERFFTMLESAGLNLQRLPLADHHAFDQLPWPADTPEVVVTEKDAVKLAGHTLGETRVWVAPLDFVLPADIVQAALAASATLSPRR